eukprot:gene33725-45166_t
MERRATGGHSVTSTSPDHEPTQMFRPASTPDMFTVERMGNAMAEHAGHDQAVVFISATTLDFADARPLVAAKLRLPNLFPHVQEDFVATGTPTLEKLADYIQRSDAVLHLVGPRPGAMAAKDIVTGFVTEHPETGRALHAVKDIDAILKGDLLLSYTQWEALLAIAFGKLLIIATPKTWAVDFATAKKAGRALDSQQAHLARLNALHKYHEIGFDSAHELTIEVFRSAIGTLFRAQEKKLVGITRPNNLPFISLGDLFKGRDNDMERVTIALNQGGPRRHGAAAVTSEAIHGLGGIGKTRLAIEYARDYAINYSALLFVSAETPATLTTNMSAL